MKFSGLRFAVIGDPVEHSRSPELHKRFLAEAGLDGTYERIRVPAGGAAAAVDALRRNGYTGLNVTTPLKEEAFRHADVTSDLARATGAVNTLVLGSSIYGTNTDGAGALGVLADAGVADFRGLRVLVLGAGPTARAALAALSAAGAETFVWNRTAGRLRDAGARHGASVYEAGLRPDAVFAALAPDAEPSDADLRATLLAAPILVDANYGERATLARALGRGGVDGTRMLEHGARASFAVWTQALHAGAVP